MHVSKVRENNLSRRHLEYVFFLVPTTPVFEIASVLNYKSIKIMIVRTKKLVSTILITHQSIFFT